MHFLQDDPSHTPALVLMKTMLSAMPCDMQQETTWHLRHTLEHGLPPGAQAMLSEQAEGAARMFGMHAGPTAGAGQSVAVAHRHTPLPL